MNCRRLMLAPCRAPYPTTSLNNSQALYGFEYVLMLPSRNSSLFTGGATMLDGAVLADVGQIAVQNQSMFLGCE